MVQRVYAAAVCGMECRLIFVEADVSDGLPCMEMVGYLSSEVKEAKERVRVAMKNSGYRLPPKRITVNLAPVYLRKDGNVYDLPVALAVLLAAGFFDAPKLEEELKHTIIVGELGLSGGLKPVRGILPMLVSAKGQGITRCLVPYANRREAALVEGIEVRAVACLQEACVLLEQGFRTNACLYRREVMAGQTEEVYEDDFSYIRGQCMAKKAAEIAAAGFHSLLLSGPPGAGKSMIAKCIPSILPPPTNEESLEISMLHSIAGTLDGEHPLITKRLFYSPHHTATSQALAGSGKNPRPGIISLAHRSVLFLDELPEFGRNHLDVLRQPMEDKKIQIARSGGNIEYPADFMLVAAMNPCPCGYYPDQNRCHCTVREVEKYQRRISGPLLDRFDMIVRIEPVTAEELVSVQKAEDSAAIRKRVLEARKRQKRRFADKTERFNSELTTEEIAEYCKLGQTERTFLKQLYSDKRMSARVYYRILRLARTIADLDGEDCIRMEHLAQAVCFRADTLA